MSDQRVPCDKSTMLHSNNQSKSASLPAHRAVETNVQVVEERGVCAGKALDRLLVVRRVRVVYIGQNCIQDVGGHYEPKQPVSTSSIQTH